MNNSREAENSLVIPQESVWWVCTGVRLMRAPQNDKGPGIKGEKVPQDQGRDVSLTVVC